jgi:hypothetical protein
MHTFFFKHYINVIYCRFQFDFNYETAKHGELNRVLHIFQEKGGL